MPTWTHRIILNSVDITAQTMLGASVDETENASHVADFLYRPASGVQDPDGLTLQTVHIDVDVGSGWQALFDGRVIRAVWSVKRREYAVRASNRLQEHFRAMGSTAAVLAALPGVLYSEAIFGEAPEDLWEYAQRCLETIEKDVHLDRAGSLAQIDWAAKGTPDFVLDGDDIHNRGAFELRRPDADELINEVKIDYEYRVQRHKVRSNDLSWTAWSNNVDITGWCEWAIGLKASHSFDLPGIDLVRSAIEGGSWTMPDGVAYTMHPASGSNLCGVSPWVWISTEGVDICNIASATGYRAFAQSIWETYQITIQALASQAYYGSTITESKQGSLDVPSDPSWPPAEVDPPTGWSTDAIGDDYQDQEDEPGRGNDLQAWYQWAAQRIRGAHRDISIVANTDLSPQITLAATVEINSYGLNAKGKVRRLRHILAAGDNEPHTEVTLAISRGNGGATDSWSVPARPDTTDPGYPAPPAFSNFSTYVGAWVGAPAAPVPDDRLGWITNVFGSAYDSGAPQYDLAFRIEWPEIEDEAAEERTEDVPSTWEIAVPHDLLTIS